MNVTNTNRKEHLDDNWYQWMDIRASNEDSRRFHNYGPSIGRV